MTDERFEDFLATTARDYNTPPPAPREEMWNRIEEARRFRRPRRTGWKTWSGWGVGIAAVLAVGIGIGRMSQPVEEAPTDGGSASYRVATVQHLSQAEVLLTSIRSRSRQDDQNADELARELLSTTRLLLDSPAASDPELKRLLEDLELLLAQIAQMPAEGRAHETEIVKDALEEGDMLPRLRARVPAGTPRVSL